MKKIILITVIFVLGMVNFVGASEILLDRVVVVIDKEVITWSELYKAMEFEMRKELSTLDNKERVKYLNEYGDLFLERMIDMKIQLIYAKKHGISISPQEVDATIVDISSKNSLTVDEFKARIQQEGFNWEEYKELMTNQLIISKVVRLEVRNKVLVPDEKITEYLNQNPNIAKSVVVRLRQIFISAKEKKSEKMALAKDLYTKIKSGEDFQALAAQYSQGSNAKTGGDLGYVALDDLNDRYKKEITNLMIGQTTLPFETNDGITLLQLVDKKDPPSAKQLKEEVKEKLFGDLFEKEHKNWIKTLKEKTYMEILL
ncbi:MAG: peptidylprolyl isomerase [Nitrospirae bacterium]|nr:peptidylprolyl isomerase [Nitrospirota bacterium]